MGRNVIVSVFSILHSIDNFKRQAFSLYVVLFLLSVCFRPTRALAYFWYLFSLRNRVANDFAPGNSCHILDQTEAKLKPFYLHA